MRHRSSKRPQNHLPRLEAIERRRREELERIRGVEEAELAKLRSDARKQGSRSDARDYVLSRISLIRGKYAKLRAKVNGGADASMHRERKRYEPE